MELTLEQAVKIRLWRVEMGCTWRRVADYFAMEWPELGTNPGNQLDGIALCDMAMETLGETVHDGWND